jgi:hypothetical protein
LNAAAAAAAVPKEVRHREREKEREINKLLELGTRPLPNCKTVKKKLEELYKGRVL